MRRLSLVPLLIIGLLAATLPVPAAAQSLSPNPTINTLQPDLTASLSASAGTVGGGDQVVYTLTVQNPGVIAFSDPRHGTQYWNTPASGVSLLQTLPAASTF